MLHSIQLIDHKNHADTTIQLSDLTLLVGPNGAGKSGLLQAICLASRLLHEPARKVLTGSDDPRLITRRDLGGCFRGVLRTGEFLSSVGDDWVLHHGEANAAGAGR